MSEAAQYQDLLVLMALAVAAPLLTRLAQRINVSAVVLEILLGMIVGPHALGWVSVEGVIDGFATFGLALLFFLAGFEIDPQRLRGRPIRLATASWFGSFGIALAIGGVLAIEGIVVDSLLVGIALTTTALGALLPILRDQGELKTPFGQLVMANGAAGEFFPIVAIALLIAGNELALEAALLVGFMGLVGVALWLSTRARPDWLDRALRTGLRTSSQLPVRLCLLLVALLVWVAAELGLDILLGAFAAGVVTRFGVGGHSDDEDVELLTGKLEGIGFGIFIPIFFVATGVRFDLDALASAGTIVRTAMFLALLLAARGVPVWLVHRRELGGRDRAALALFSSAALPLIVAITTIGVDTGRMRPINATALVAAGMLSVLLFPVVAAALRRRGGAPDPLVPSPATSPATEPA